MKKYISLLWAFMILNIAFALNLDDALNLSNEALKGSQATVWGFIQWGNEVTEDEIIASLHEKGITIHENWKDFMAEKSIRRDEAAKMLTLAVPYLPNWNNIKKADGISCSFEDQNLAWSDLRDILTQSCEKWLFKGSNGKFNPQSSITNAQLLTVLWRMLYGMQDESWEHYASKYISLLENAWYLENISIPQSQRDKVAQRGTLAKLLMRVIE